MFTLVMLISQSTMCILNQNHHHLLMKWSYKIYEHYFHKFVKPFYVKFTARCNQIVIADDIRDYKYMIQNRKNNVIWPKSTWQKSHWAVLCCHIEKSQSGLPPAEKDASKLSEKPLKSSTDPLAFLREWN